MMLILPGERTIFSNHGASRNLEIKKEKFSHQKLEKIIKTFEENIGDFQSGIPLNKISL